MARIELKRLSFAYPDHTSALVDINLAIETGECVVIGGASGSGKSTLLRMLKQEIQPVGRMTGKILYDGTPLAEHDPKRLAQEVGMIFQDPENQIVMDEVQQELAFGLENLGYSTTVIRKRVAEMVHFFGLEDLLSRRTYELSGGQKQLVNLAAILLMQPKVLLLDEPTSQLDPIAAREFLQMVKRVNEELGMMVVLVEHRLEDVFGLADRVLLMKEGAIRYSGTPQSVIKQVWTANDQQFIPYLPAISKIYLEVSHGECIPTSVKEGRHWVLKEWERDEMPQGDPLIAVGEMREDHQEKGRAILQLEHINFRYHRHALPVLSDLQLTLHEHDFLVIVGGNGAGKTTLLQVAAGLLEPKGGTVRLYGQKLSKQSVKERFSQIGYLAQNPKLYFVHDTVEQELDYVVRNFGSTWDRDERQAFTDRLGITHLMQKHPYDCSGGEQQKVALACVLLAKPKVLLIDEPTKGLDPLSKREFGLILEELRTEGMTIMMVTHDIEFAAYHATRCAMLFHGEITSEEAPVFFFQGNYFYTTVTHRIFRDCLPSAITYEEVLAQWPVLRSSL